MLRYSARHRSRFEIGAGYELFLRHDGIYPLLRLLCRDMVALHDALDADRNGSRYADHEIEVDTAVETAIERMALSIHS